MTVFYCYRAGIFQKWEATPAEAASRRRYLISNGWVIFKTEQLTAVPAT